MQHMTENNNYDLHEATATATWSRLLAGNHRFRDGKAVHPWQDSETRQSLVEGQNPDAAVLACSDSRVPPELIFDTGLGDLFTVRNAGQILDFATLSSLEFAVSELHVSLLVVLGHEQCGTMKVAKKTVETYLEQAQAQATDEIDTFDMARDAMACDTSIIVREVGASLLDAAEAEITDSADVERVHIARTIEQLVDRSSVIAQAVAEERLVIVGARYQLKSGVVEVLSF